jgi:predicted methyltransferase
VIILSHFQANHLIQSKDHNQTVLVSPDLGLSEVEVMLNGGVFFPDNEYVSWETIAKIIKNKNSCYAIIKGGAAKVQEYSETLGRVYTLYPTESAPTMLVSGIPMHRIKRMNPWDDTRNKIKAFSRVGGHVLDTATGLGYTAILAAESASQVTTIELDPAAQRIAAYNPWSQKLFNDPKIKQVIGDTSEVINNIEDRIFTGIIHDPPMFSLAGALYALVFYQQAYRVLKPDGRMFHYIGNPESKSGGRMTRGVIKRLKRAGFSRVIPQPAAFGVMAYK